MKIGGLAMKVSEDIVEILERLVSFRTTADNPDEMLKAFTYLISLFDNKKFRTVLVEHNGKLSLLVSFRWQDALRPAILLNGHLDVVPAEGEDQYALRIEGGRAFGRGTCDMKGMIAVYVVVMQELANMESPPSVALLINGDEETSGKDGVEYLVKEMGLRPDFVLCGDMMHESDYQIIVKEAAGLWVELSAKGKSAHAAEQWKGENAIEKVVKAVNKVKRFVGKAEPGAWKSTMNFATIETSNRTWNKVPSDAKAVLDIRFTEELARTPEELLLKLQKLVSEVEVRCLASVSLFSTDENDPRILHLKEVGENITGQDVPLTFEQGASDMRFFAEAGVPGVLFGCIGDNAHAKDEWVDLESLTLHKKITLRFLKSSR